MGLAGHDFNSISVLGSTAWYNTYTMYNYCFSRASITFLDRDGDKKTVSAKYGESLLDVAKNNDIDLEGCCIYIYLNLDSIPLHLTQHNADIETQRKTHSQTWLA